MRAMMSDAGSGGRERSHVVSTFGALAADQRRAESEARRVLAVAEPESEGVALPPCRIRPFLPVGSVGALAEALSAFVGAPDPAAYLARVSR